MTQDSLDLVHDEEAFGLPEPKAPRFRLTMFFAGVIVVGLFFNWIGGF